MSAAIFSLIGTIIIICFIIENSNSTSDAIYTRLCTEIKWESPSCKVEKQKRLKDAGLEGKP